MCARNDSGVGSNDPAVSGSDPVRRLCTGVAAYGREFSIVDCSN